MNEFHFLRPSVFYALIPCLLFFILRWRVKTNTSAWHRICDHHLIKSLLISQSTKSIKWMGILGLMWLVSIIALAGPTWEKIPRPVFKKQHALVITLDVSPSMLAQDVKPDRITRARYKVIDLLKQWPDGQVALVVFAGEGYTVTPLTDDIKTIENMLPEISPYIMPEYGANIAAGLKQAEKLIKNANQTDASIILITDSEANASTLETAEKLKAQGITVSVLGIGTKKGAPIPTPQGYLKNRSGSVITSRLNTRNLKELASQGGGEYLTYTSNTDDIKQLLTQQHFSALGASPSKSKANVNVWLDFGRYFMLFLLPLCLLLFRKGWLNSEC